MSFTVCFLLLPIIFKLSSSSIVSQQYDAVLNSDVLSSIKSASLIITYSLKGQLECVVACNQIQSCTFITYLYDPVNPVCNLYKYPVKLVSSDYVFQQGMNVYKRKMSELNETCFESTCNSAKMLVCNTNVSLCQCDDSIQTWSSSLQKCVDKATCVPLANTSCLINAQCDSAKGLVCSAGFCKCNTNTVWSCYANTCLGCPAGWVKLSNGNCYYISTTTASQVTAESNCRKLNAKLMIVDDNSENSVMAAYLDTIGKAYYWTSGIYSLPNAGFVWSDGTSLANTAWLGSLTNPSSEACLAWYYKGGHLLSNLKCDLPQNYVCEF